MFVQIYKMWSASTVENLTGSAETAEGCERGVTLLTLPPLWAIFSRAQLVWYQTIPNTCLYVRTTDPGNHPWSTQHICAFFMFILCVKVVDFVDFNSHSLWNSVLMKLSARTAVSRKNFHEILEGCSLSCPFFHRPKSRLSNISLRWVCCQSTFLGKNLLFPSYTFPA